MRFIIFLSLIILMTVHSASIVHSQNDATNVLGIEFVLIPSDEFMMGSEEGDSDEKPIHRVKLDSFYIGKYEITQSQWKQVMGSNPSEFSGCEKCPVETISWDEVQEFIRRAKGITGLTFRLPTEAEWEYSAGSGNIHQTWSGTNQKDNLNEYSWYQLNSDGHTHPVGMKKPNLLKLYDMSGNVSEWVSDGYDSGFYSRSPVDNPFNESVLSNYTKHRVIRGDCWDGIPSADRVAGRRFLEQASKNSYVGFRVAIDGKE